jgi:restriction endonuclease Mrr
MADATIGYCVRCHEKREMQDSQNFRMESGKWFTAGRCGICNMRMLLPLGGSLGSLTSKDKEEFKKFLKKAWGPLRRKEPEESIEEIAYTIENLPESSSERLIDNSRIEIFDTTEDLIDLLKSHPGNIFSINHRRLEEVVARLLEGRGWDVEITPATRDGGLDIFASKDNSDLGRLLCLVEVKQRQPEKSIGVGVVRSLFGTLCDHQANKGILVTTSHFSKDAEQFQERHHYQLGLRKHDHIMEWIRAHGRGIG